MNIGRFQLYTEMDEDLHFILKYGLFEKEIYFMCNCL